MQPNIKIGTGEFIKIQPSENSSAAFGRLRVAETSNVFDSKFLYDKLPLLWDELNYGGTSIHSSGNACIDMTVSASGQSIIRQSKYRFNYNPGKSQQYIFTGVIGSGTPNLIRRVGCFDNDNGMFFESSNNNINLCIRKSGVDIKTERADWNNLKLINDNTNIVLDLNKTQIFTIDYQWLGVGTVRFGFNIEGDNYYVHKKHFSNNLSEVYTSTPNLPIRYEVISHGGSGTLKQICSTCISEGGHNRWLTRSENTPTAINANVIGIEYTLLGLKLKDSHKSATISVDNISLLALTNDSFKWSLYLNPTMSGTLTYTNVPNSYLMVGRTAGGNPSAETIIAGLTKLAEGYGSTTSRITNAGLDNLYSLGSTISGLQDELILSVTPYSVNLDIHGSIGWKEYI